MHYIAATTTRSFSHMRFHLDFLFSIAIANHVNGRWRTMKGTVAIMKIHYWRCYFTEEETPLDPLLIGTLSANCLLHVFKVVQEDAGITFSEGKCFFLGLSVAILMVYNAICSSALWASSGRSGWNYWIALCLKYEHQWRKGRPP